MLRIIKAIRDNIEQGKMERAKERELVQLIEGICSDDSKYVHELTGIHRFKEITPFLKPCPYCGGEVTLGYQNEMYVLYPNRYSITCRGKGCHFSELMTLSVTPDTVFRQLKPETREKYMRQIICEWNNQEDE